MGHQVGFPRIGLLKAGELLNFLKLRNESLLGSELADLLGVNWRGILGLFSL